MTKRESRAKRTNMAAAATAHAASAVDTLDSRVVVFAEQLGRVVGTVQARAAGLLDRDALKKQVTSIRDNAAALLEHMTVLEKSAAKSVKKAVATATNTNGRSGGFVDAPGKKHRKPMPVDLHEASEHAKAATTRASKTMAKTSRLRGRG
jgi:hypothetical protein